MIAVRRQQGLAAAPRPPGPSLPTEVAHLWEAWVHLDQTRAAGFSGAVGIAPSEIEAYGRLMGRTFAPWEAGGLLALDRARLSFEAEQQASKDRTS